MFAHIMPINMRQTGFWVNVKANSHISTISLAELRITDPHKTPHFSQSQRPSAGLRTDDGPRLRNDVHHRSFDVIMS
jgi:hypothetical protein